MPVKQQPQVERLASVSNPNTNVRMFRYREMHGIIHEVHTGYLEEDGWSEDQLLAGFRQTKAPRDGLLRFLEYEALVARELTAG